jgi:hypothetical protein
MISTCARGSIGEERYELKGSRTVLKRGLGGDSHSYFNILHRQFWDRTKINQGDRLEIVTIVGGG